MNRLKTLFFTLLLILVFTACEGLKEEDTTLPTFQPMVNKTIPFGIAFDPLGDVSANDNIDGDITSDVECAIYDSYGTEAFDVNVTDVYTQICTVMDAAGNTATKERIITIQDEIIGAVISGIEDTVIGYGTYFDPLANLEIIDKLDGNITEDVVVHIYYKDPNDIQIETIDTSIIRTYYIDYIIINSLDIKTELRIEVDVVDNIGPVITATDLETINLGMYNLLYQVTATDEIHGPIEDITYTLYDSLNNEVEYTEYLYGEFTIIYEAVDPVGNIGTKEVSLSLVDIFIPEITVSKYVLEILPGDSIDIEGNFTISDTSDENLTITYEIKDMNTETIVENLTNTDYGFYEVTVEAIDKGEQRDQKTFYVNITTGELIPVELNINSAILQLDEFYDVLRGQYFSIEEFCRMYVSDLAFDVNITYEECTAGVYNVSIKTSNQRFLDTTTETIEGITYYTTEVEFFRPDENVFNEITYHIVQYEHSLYPHIVFDTDPFEVEYPIYVYQPDFEAVDNNIVVFYSLMNNPTYSNPQFCYAHVIEAPYNVMTINECLDITEKVDLSFISYSVDNYKAISIPFGDGDPLDGYEAEVTITRTHLVQTVTVRVIFFEQGNKRYINFVDGFFGPDFNYDLIFASGSSISREDEISVFYDALLNTTVSSSMFCESQIMISPIYDYELDPCISYVEDIRDENVSYTINSITPITIGAFNGTLEAYTLDITFNHDGVDQNLLIEFKLLYIDGEFFPIFFDLYLVNLNYDEELNHAVFGFRAYPGIIQGFYDDVMDIGMSDTEFCNMYLLTGGTENLPLTNQECSLIRIDLLKGTYSFTVEEIIYQDIGDPQYPPIYRVDMTQNVFRDYRVDFTMYYNPLGELIIKVNLNDALGGGFE